ncbi:efflux RND transporter periplasmic adaptor subunit [Psychrobacter sp. AOP7-B1-24]|uniref:efflux RND transporter periplasmic adaptor subunit n=1 Tax=Psychrobacter sp. AOP7-B1-24 TaxID=3457645 RepID=UPI00402B82AB
MTAFRILKTSSYLSGVLLLLACQPPLPVDESAADEDSAVVDTPVVITNDSVTITPEHILSIKSSRYQPSLGLQGKIKPIRQTTFITAYPINVEKVLVTKGQWIEKGTPLLIVRRLNTEEKTTNLPNTSEGSAPQSDNSEQETPAQHAELTSDTANIKPKNTEGAENTENTDANLTHAETTTNNSDTTAKSNSVDTESPATANSAIEVNNADINAHDKQVNGNNSLKHSQGQYGLTTVYASFSGRVEDLYAKVNQTLKARTPLLTFNDETQLYFTSTLPVQAEPQLSVGQTVNFTVENMSEKFTGQISKLTITSQPKKLLVNVDVIDNEVSRDKLLPNMKATGRVNYGQIDVGTTVPKRALHDVDLTELQTPPYKPLVPLTANVWIIGQDQRLKQQPIEVVEYNPDTNQYLIAGISNDSLICLADLPVSSSGKIVKVS